MPFWRCERCGERVYSATPRPRKRECPACGHPLPELSEDDPPPPDLDGAGNGSDPSGSDPAEGPAVGPELGR